MFLTKEWQGNLWGGGLAEFIFEVGDMEYIMDLSTKRKVKGISNLSDMLSDAVGTIEMRI